MPVGDLRMSEHYFEEDFSAFASLFAEGAYRTVARRYQAGDTISSQGETLSHGYYIRRGTMQLKVGTEVGKERTIAFFGPGSVFPLGINEHHYRMEYAMAEVALNDVEALELSYTELRRMVDDHPDLGVRMIVAGGPGRLLRGHRHPADR